MSQKRSKIKIKNAVDIDRTENQVAYYKVCSIKQPHGVGETRAIS